MANQVLPLTQFTLAQFCFPEGSGTTSQDNTGDYIATLNGGATWSSDTPNGVGNSILLNGTSGFITVASLLQGVPVRDATFAFWLKPTVNYPAASGNPRLMSLGQSGGAEYIDWTYNTIGAGGAMLVGSGTGSVANPTISGTANIAAGTWNRIVLVYSQSLVNRIYLNGVKVAQVLNQSSPVMSNAANYLLAFGCSYDNVPHTGSAFISGRYAEIMVEKRAWTQSDATADYATSTRFPSIPLKLSIAKQIGGGAGDACAWSEMNILQLGPSNYLHIFTKGWLNERIWMGKSMDGMTVIPGNANPIIGGGAAGESATTIGRSFLATDPNGSIYCFYTTTPTTGDLRYSISNDDGVTWSNVVTILAVASYSSWVVGFNRGGIILDSDGVYKMMLGYVATGSPNTYQASLWTATSLTGPWTPSIVGPIVTLRVYSTAFVGNPGLFKVGTTYYCNFHSGPASGLPSSCYIASCTSLADAWTIGQDSIPIIPIDFDNPAIDQSGDNRFSTASIGVISNYASTINAQSFDRIMANIYRGTLAEFVTDGAFLSPDSPNEITPDSPLLSFVPNDAARKIVAAVTLGVQRKLAMTSAQVYPAVIADYIEGSNPLTVQVVPSDETPESGGVGYQEGGGALQRRMIVTLAAWKQLNEDQYRQSEELLEAEAYGAKDFQETLRFMFSMTTLGGLCLEPVRWEGASAAKWHDWERGIIYFDARISACWAIELPTSLTITDADLYMPTVT